MPKGPVLQPQERYALLGKTRSGKTSLGMVLSSIYGQSLPDPWEVWWIDSKGDPADIRALRKWGAVNGGSEKDILRPGGLKRFKYFKLEEYTDEYGVHSIVDQAQALIKRAYDRRHIIVVADEYTQICPSDRSEGYALKNVFTRGGGRKIGLIGMTQEPVYIPRKLISQATHIALFNLTHNYDIEYAKKLYRDYIPPIERGDPYGFYWKHVDGNSGWLYYKHQREWYDSLKLSLPKKDLELMKELEGVK
jgi:hypothetical protein